MTKFLEVFGFIILYLIWLISPIIMVFGVSSDDDIIITLAGTVYISGALVIGCVFSKFIGIW